MFLNTLYIYTVRISNIGIALIPLALWIGGGYLVFRIVRSYARKFEGRLW